MPIDLTTASKRALLVELISQQHATNERIIAMSDNVVALQSTIAQLSAVVTAMVPVLDAAEQFSANAVAGIEQLLATIQAQAADNATIGALATQADALRATLSAEAAELSTANDALQAELAKVPPTT